MSAVESWFASSAVAEPLPRQRPQRRTPPRARPKAKQRQWRAFRVRGSLLWMALFAVLLVGVVAVNVAVLRAHVSVTDLDAKISQLQRGNASLALHYARMTAVRRVEAAAGQAGLVPAPGADTTLISMGIGK